MAPNDEDRGGALRRSISLIPLSVFFCQPFLFRRWTQKDVHRSSVVSERSLPSRYLANTASTAEALSNMRSSRLSLSSSPFLGRDSSTQVGHEHLNPLPGGSTHLVHSVHAVEWNASCSRCLVITECVSADKTSPGGGTSNPAIASPIY